MRLNKIFALLTVPFLLNGCVSLKADFKPATVNTTVVSVHTDVPIPNPVITPMQLNSVHFQIYDLAALKALVTQMTTTGQNNTVFYVLDQNNFQNLGANLAEMKRYIDDQTAKNDYLIAAIKINAGKSLTLTEPLVIPPAKLQPPIPVKP